MTITTGAPESILSHYSTCQTQGEGEYSHFSETDMRCRQCASSFFSGSDHFSRVSEGLEFTLEELRAAVENASDVMPEVDLDELRAAVENASDVMPEVDLDELRESLGLTDEDISGGDLSEEDLAQLAESPGLTDETMSEEDLFQLAGSVNLDEL